MKMTPEDFRGYRKSLNLSQHDLAKKIGVNRSTILRYEAGDCEIPTPTAMLIKILAGRNRK